MYYEFYGLTKEPFHVTPDPYFFFPSSSHKEAFAAMIYGLQNRKGFIALTGEVGSGKTTVLRSFLEAGRSTRMAALFRDIDTSKLKTIFVFNPDLSFKNLLRLIYAELGISLPNTYLNSVSKSISEQTPMYPPSDEQIVFELVQHLHTELIREYQEGNHIVLIIDEAQNMPVRTLENLRMLSNLETAMDKLMQIYLIGQPEFDKLLQEHELRQLRQRIAVRARLKPLNKKETLSYIEHRLWRAGAEHKNIFTGKALKAIHDFSGGIPRRINILCDNALINGYATGKQKIGAAVVKDVIDDLQEKPRIGKWKLALIVGLLLCVLASGVWFTYHHTNLMQRVRPHLKSSLLQRDERQDTQKENRPARPLPAKESGSSRNDGKAEQHPETSQQASPSSIEGIDFPQGLFKDLEQQFDNLTRNEYEHTFKDDHAQNINHRPSLSANRPTEASNGFPDPETFPGTAEEKALSMELSRRVPVYSQLTTARKIVLLQMAKHMGLEGLLTFQRMLAALEQENFNEAARQMILSNWEGQVGGKAYDLAKIMRTGRIEAE